MNCYKVIGYSLRVLVATAILVSLTTFNGVALFVFSGVMIVLLVAYKDNK